MAVIPSTGQDWQSFRYVALHEKTAVFMVVLDRICMSQDVYTWHTQEVEFSMEPNHFINLLKPWISHVLRKGWAYKSTWVIQVLFLSVSLLIDLHTGTFTQTRMRLCTVLCY